MNIFTLLQVSKEPAQDSSAHQPIPVLHIQCHSVHTVGFTGGLRPAGQTCYSVPHAQQLCKSQLNYACNHMS